MKNRMVVVVMCVATLFGCSDEDGSVSQTPQVLSETTSMTAPESESELKFKEGLHYSLLKRLPPSREPQVIKFISYLCPACRLFESTSKLSVGEEVTVERFPVSFGRESWAQTAKAYATLRTLNVHNELSWPLFQAVQDFREPMGDKAYFAKWLSERTSLTEAEVIAAYDHDKTAELIAMYRAAEHRYAISAVPTVYVNGNIYINLREMEGESQAQKMIFFNELVDYLIAHHGKA